MLMDIFDTEIQITKFAFSFPFVTKNMSHQCYHQTAVIWEDRLI